MAFATLGREEENLKIKGRRKSTLNTEKKNRKERKNKQTNPTPKYPRGDTNCTHQTQVLSERNPGWQPSPNWFYWLTTKDPHFRRLL